MKRDIFSTVLDYAYEGIVTVDQQHRITALNPFAQKLAKFDKGSAVGQFVEKVFPQLHLGKVVESGKEDLHRIASVGSTKVMCNKVPIAVDGKSYGAVATFQDIGEIREMEAKIRQQMYARGHIAKFRFEDIIGRSDCMAQAIRTAKKFAATKSSLLLLGETGTGKEVFAQSIHNGSPYAKGPFVALNCAALPANLLESELFGYVGGAFTGASKEGKPGLFEIAHGGTIFLDEIAEMDYVNQGRLLRFLQEKVIVRLGSHKVLPIDARIIAATNKDLELLVSEHKFRDDLYYRLNVLSLELPSLQERKSDIHLYAAQFLKEFSTVSGRALRLTKEALHLLESYAWPGNIREFRNIMERIAAVSETDVVGKDAILGVFKRNHNNPPPLSSRDVRLLRELEKALQASGGNQSAAAKQLGISRTTLWRKIKKFQIEP